MPTVLVEGVGAVEEPTPPVAELYQRTVAPDAPATLN